MDNRLIFLYHAKLLCDGGRRRIGQPVVGSAGSKPKGDGERNSVEVIESMLPRKALARLA